MFAVFVVYCPPFAATSTVKVPESSEVTSGDSLQAKNKAIYYLKSKKFWNNT